MNQMRNATKEGAQMQPAYTEYAHLYILYRVYNMYVALAISTPTRTVNYESLWPVTVSARLR